MIVMNFPRYVLVLIEGTKYLAVIEDRPFLYEQKHQLVKCVLIVVILEVTSFLLISNARGRCP